MLFGLPDYSLIAAILPIIWAIYVKRTSETGIQIHFTNRDFNTTIGIRNGSNNHLFVDDAVCYKSRKHKYRFHSSDNNKSLMIAPGEECQLILDTIPFVEFINTLKLNKNEFLALRIKLYTSRGVLTTGWIGMNRKEDSQYGFVFINNPRTIVLKTETNPIFSEYVEYTISALIISGLALSLIFPKDPMANIVILILLTILFLGPFAFIKGFKNDRTSSLKCIALGILLGIMLYASTKDPAYITIGMVFTMMIFLEVQICSGGVVFDSETDFDYLPIHIRIKRCFHRKSAK